MHMFICVISVMVASGGGDLFRTEVAPILARRCVSCHCGQKPKGKYSLETPAKLFVSGISGQEPVVPGKPADSFLVRKLRLEHSRQRMPPDDHPLPNSDVAAITRWVQEGARVDEGDRDRPTMAVVPARVHPAAPKVYPRPLPIHALAFSVDSKMLAAGGVHEITVWDIQNGLLQKRLSGAPRRVHAIVAMDDGYLVAGGTAGEYGEARWLSSQGASSRVYGPFPDLGLSLALSPARDIIYVGSADGVVRSYRRSDGTLLWAAPAHSDWVTSLAVSPDGSLVVSASKDRTVKILEATGGHLFTTYNGHRRQYNPHAGQFEVYAVAAVGQELVSAGGGAAIRLWNANKAREENGSAADMEERFANAGHTRYLEYKVGLPVFALATGAGHVWSVGGDGIVRRHQLASGKLTGENKGHDDWAQAMALAVDGATLATGGFDGTVIVWEPTTLKLLKRFVATPGFAGESP